PSSQSTSMFNSLNSIQSLPPKILKDIRDAFSDAIRWAYVALIPFVAVAAIGGFFLREVKITRTPEEEAQRQQELNKVDHELGRVPNENREVPRGRRPRVKVYGPIMAIIWCCQAIGDMTGLRK